jgi:hypothetical protein
MRKQELTGRDRDCQDIKTEGRKKYKSVAAMNPSLLFLS